MLCIADRVMGTKIRSEFLGEPRVIIHPQWAELRISQQELRLKPIECHALEVGLGIDDLHMVIVKGLWVVLEVQLTLHKERTEFLGVGTVKLVRFVDLRPTLRFRRLMGGSGGTSEGGDCSHKLQQDLVHQVILKIVIVAIIVRSTIQGATRGAVRGGGGPLAM